MECINQTVPICEDACVSIGRVGENIARTINFDLQSWQDRIDEHCTYAVVFKRPDGVIYPLVCDFDGRYVSVLITSTETAIAGSGEIELRVQKGDMVLKSRNYRTRCLNSIIGESEPPIPPGQEWFESLLEEINAGGLTDNQIAAAIDRYLAEHPSSGSGQDGVGITNIVKTNTQGLVDTYTVTLSDNSTHTFTVTNGRNGTNGADGRGILSVNKTGVSGLIDVYTITYTDNTTSTFTVTNGASGEGGTGGGADGRGIVSITNTGTTGLTDTYTISYTDGTTSTFTVRNGAPGTPGQKGADGQNGANGTNGVGITNIAKTSTSGLVDTYTITMSNGGTYTFTVTNGADGADGEGGSSSDDNTFLVTVSSAKIANKTSEEIFAAYNSGKTVKCVYANSFILQPIMINSGNAYFSAAFPEWGLYYSVVISHSTATVTQPPIPLTDSTSHGQLLSVDAYGGFTWIDRSTIVNDVLANFTDVSEVGQ